MYVICPQCKSKNVKSIHTEIENIQSKCLDCNHKFTRRPTIEERDAFNK